MGFSQQPWSVHDVFKVHFISKTHHCNSPSKGPRLCAHQKDASIALEAAIKTLGSKLSTQVAPNTAGCQGYYRTRAKKNSQILVTIFIYSISTLLGLLACVQIALTFPSREDWCRPRAILRVVIWLQGPTGTENLQFAFGVPWDSCKCC